MCTTSVDVRALLVVVLLASMAAATPLDDYVNRPEPLFAFSDTGVKLTGTGWSGHVWNFTSQQWLTSADSSRSVWWHYLAVIVPDNIDATCDMATLYITGGNNDDADFPTSGDEEVLVVSILAQRTRCASAVLYQIPNSPIVFPVDPVPGKQRTEDEIIALTWWRFMMHSRADASAADWILELPMTKGGVKALDVLQKVVPLYNGGIPITRFMVAGASKRGWTTWLVGAVDKRVIGIAPIVLDALGVQAFMHRQFRMYGAFTFALRAYWELNVTQMIDTPAADALFAICDPLSYATRYNHLPRLMISAGGDEFQMPDDQRHWRDKMAGEMNFLVVKNADHSEDTGIAELVPAACAFAEALKVGLPRPRLVWSIDDATGNITITTDTEPVAMSVAVADSPQDVSAGKRDFRWAALNVDPCPQKVFGACVRPVLWATYPLNASLTSLSAAAATFANTSTSLLPSDVWHSHTRLPGGALSVTVGVPLPRAGVYRAFMIEVAWSNLAGADDFELTSGVSVIPNTLPFPDCHGDACKGTLC